MASLPIPRIARTDDPVADLGRYWLSRSAEQRELLVATMSPAAIEAVERAKAKVARLGWRATPFTLGRQLGLIDDLPHTRFLANKFVDAFEGRSPRQIWNLPPQHGKSLVASRLGPAWGYDADPELNLALTSYGDTLADEHASFVRDLLVDHSDVFDVRLRRDRKRMDRFVTTGGGGLIAAGRGSGLTGFGANGIIVDDPFKDWVESHSEATRERVWNWFRSVVLSRLNHRKGIPAFVIVVMTRWHEDDLTGKLLAQDLAGDGEGWELVRLPAIAEIPNPKATDPRMGAPDPLGRDPGEVLAPTLHDLEEMTKRMTSSGSYLAAGMYQQRPAPEEGTDIMRGWFRWDASMPTKFDDALTSWDMKLKDKEAGDYVVGQVWGRTGADYWCVDSVRGQWNMPTSKAAVALVSVRHPSIKRHVIENTGYGPELLRELRRADPTYVLSDEIASKLGMTEDERAKVQALLRRGMNGCVPENVKGDKRVRMRAQTGIIEGGHVHLPENAGWADLLVDEAAMFPNGTHDDQVDAMSQALKRLSTSPAKAKRPSSAPMKKPPIKRSSGQRAPIARRGAQTRTRFGRR